MTDTVEPRLICTGNRGGGEMNEARRTSRLYEKDRLRRQDEAASRFDDAIARGRARVTETPRRFRLRWPTVYEWFVIGVLIAVVVYLLT